MGAHEEKQAALRSDVAARIQEAVKDPETARRLARIRQQSDRVDRQHGVHRSSDG